MGYRAGRRYLVDELPRLQQDGRPRLVPEVAVERLQARGGQGVDSRVFFKHGHALSRLDERPDGHVAEQTPHLLPNLAHPRSVYREALR